MKLSFLYKWNVLVLVHCLSRTSLQCSNCANALVPVRLTFSNCSVRQILICCLLTTSLLSILNERRQYCSYAKIKISSMKDWKILHCLQLFSVFYIFNGLRFIQSIWKKRAIVQNLWNYLAGYAYQCCCSLQKKQNIMTNSQLFLFYCLCCCQKFLFSSIFEKHFQTYKSLFFYKLYKSNMIRTFTWQKSQ